MNKVKEIMVITGMKALLCDVRTHECAPATVKTSGMSSNRCAGWLLSLDARSRVSV